MNQEGLLFPKEKKKKKRKRHRKSIIPGDKKESCYLCGKHGYTHEHHIFFGEGNRRNSEEYGLKVHLCVECHETGKDAVHSCKRTRRYLEKIAQREFERQIGSRRQFVKIFGRNYLEE